MKKLNPKQQAFADFYIASGNATEAYIKAGYNEKGSRANSARLIANDSVKAYIDNRLEELKSERVADQQEVMEYLTAVMRGEHTEETLRGIGEGAQTIDDIDVSAKDRIKAAELLGKRYRMWIDKQDITAVVTPVFMDNVPEDD